MYVTYSVIGARRGESNILWGTEMKVTKSTQKVGEALKNESLRDAGGSLRERTAYAKAEAKWKIGKGREGDAFRLEPTSGSPGSRAHGLQPSLWLSSACWITLQISEPVVLHNRLSRFLIIDLFIYTYKSLNRYRDT